MLEKDLLDQLQSLANIALDKEIGEIPVNLFSKDELKLIKLGAKKVEKAKKKGEEVTCIFEIWYPLGKIAHKLRWYKEAEIFYRVVVAKNPQFPDGWFHLGLLMSARGRAAAARELFNIALQNAQPDWNKLNHVKLLAGQIPAKSQPSETSQEWEMQELEPPQNETQAN